MLLNRAEPELLGDIIAVYGEEKRARAIAKAIVARRETAPLPAPLIWSMLFVRFWVVRVSAKPIRQRARFRLYVFI